MAAPWSDDDSDQLARLHESGQSLHAIAQQMGRSKDTVSRWADKLGLTFDRSMTAKAAEAVHIDNKSKRVTLEARLLDEGGKLLDQLWDPTIVFSFGGSENLYSEHQLERPTFGDQKAIVQAVSTALTAANKLAELHNDGHDLPAVDAWLEAMTGANDDNQRPVGEVEAGS